MIYKPFSFMPALLTASLCAVFAAATPARAEMVLSQVIVDLQPGAPSRDDIEVWNNGAERIYVVAEPSLIEAPGTPAEKRRPGADPAVSGLLVTPQRLVLEPDQRRVIRVAAITPRAVTDRIYRVTIKPVAGPVSADRSALKILVGYDVLVLHRPARISGELVADRKGPRLTIRNAGNTAQELFEGKQCDAAGKTCQTLPATRLYAGASFAQDLPYDTPVEYQVTHGSGARAIRF
jgi:Mat/Ecp fimbriae periplasmic chaperone